MHSHRSTSLVALLASLLLTACGGSGSTETVLVGTFADPDLLQGTYGVLNASGTAGGPEELTVVWSSQSITPAMLTGLSATTNNTGVVGNPALGATSNAYVVHGDRRLGWSGSNDGHFRTMGGISADGSVAIMAQTRETTRPRLDVRVRQGAGLDDSVLNGAYWFGAFGAEVGGVQTLSRWGRVNFDGMGGGDITISQNVEGVISPLGNIGISYSVAANGQVSLDIFGAQTYAGWANENGELVILGGGVNAGDDPHMMVIVRQGTGFSDASSLGTWFLTGISQEIGTNTYSSFAGSLLSNNPGIVSASGFTNNEGKVEWGEPSWSIPISIADTGAFVLSTGAGEDFIGSLSDSGRFGVLAGPVNAGSNPALYVMIR